ncbi:hypothetical protein, partial [Pengzhenrongella sp.]|uniref:hypothetical protein n=1 Tax=Pengzhenrongella sp. TaxID=2888820 RepID=UPI002F93C9AD
MVAYAVALVLRDAGLIPVGVGWFGPVVDDWLGLLSMWGPAAVCWLAVWRVGFRRSEVFLASAAVTSFAAGDTYYVAMVAPDGSLPFPSPADVGYLLFYPLMLAALALAVRRHVRGLALSVWLDSAVGSLGAASVLAVVLSPVLASAMTGSLSMAMVVEVAYPLFDLLLVAAVAGIAALGGVRLGGRWGLLVVGLVVFAAADVVYALQVGAETYVLGTPLDAGWAIGLALMALWVGGAARRDGSPTQQTRSATGATALVVPAVATAAGLAVLVVSSRAHVSTLAVTLAGVTLLGAGVRTQFAFGQLRRTQSQLVDAARNAGRAEIAINVLHNVGNVLNSVNVSASLVTQRVRGSKSTGLVKVVSLLQEHAGDLGGFFSTDARGKALPGYLDKLAAVLAIERESVEEELLRLTNGVDHIKEIVSAQQSLAGVSSVVESVRVSEVMDVALRMAGVLADSEVRVVRDVPDDPLLPLDRHRVMLVLVNLIGNAMHAMKRNVDRPPQLSLTATVTAGQGVSIMVTDNGQGIPP